MRKRTDCYVMMDIESSGTRLGYHDLIQFGAVAVYGPNLEHKAAFPVFRRRAELPVNLVAPHFKGEPDPGAMKVNGLNWHDVLAHGEAPDVFITRFHNWITELKAVAGSQTVVLVGHGVTFDWSYLKLLHDQFRTDWPCHYSAMDFKSWYGGMRGLEHIDASMTEMRKEFGIGKNKAAHDAQGDADYQLEFMLLSLAKAGLIERAPQPQA